MNTFSHNLDGSKITMQQERDVSRNIKKLADEMVIINKRIRDKKRNTK